MGFINIAESKPTSKTVAQFGSVVDLAHGLISEWVYDNRELRSNCDKAFKFILQNIDSKPMERNKLEKYFFKRKLDKHRENLRELVLNLRYIATEIEDLIGNASFLKAGLKNRIKNKKQFDDDIIEYKEITIMLLGISMYLETNKTIEGNFKAEADILRSLISHPATPHKFMGYYENLYAKIGTFQFK